jgi:hypothetical protein
MEDVRVFGKIAVRCLREMDTVAGEDALLHIQARVALAVLALRQVMKADDHMVAEVVALKVNDLLEKEGITFRLVQMRSDSDATH